MQSGDCAAHLAALQAPEPSCSLPPHKSMRGQCSQPWWVCARCVQDVFNLLPNLGVKELSRGFAVQSNDMMLAIYLASLTRSVLALHNLIDNKARHISLTIIGQPACLCAGYCLCYCSRGAGPQ